jgi:hypothetical protein
MGILVTCLMTFKPLMVLWFPKFFPASHQSSSGADGVLSTGPKLFRDGSSGGRSSDKYPGRLGDISPERPPDEYAFDGLEAQENEKGGR